MNNYDFERLLATLQDVLTVYSSSKKDKQDQTSLFDVFDPAEEEFKYYVRRFEGYMESNGVKKDDKLFTQLFLNSIGSAGYRVVAKKLGSVDPQDCEYEDIIKILMENYHPAQNELIILHTLLSMKQGDQSITQYINALEKYLEQWELNFNCQECNGVPTKEIFLRTQFIRGLKDKSIQKEILKSQKKSFEEIRNFALTLEAVKLGDETSSSDDSYSRTNKIHNGRSEKSDVRGKRKSKINYRELGIENMCLRCGKTNHFAAQCRIKREMLKCDACKKIGHVRKVCITTLQKKNTN